MRFMGLICHVDRAEAGNDEEIAVLIKEDEHLPKLRVRKGFVFGEHPDNPAIVCRDLAGANIRFSLGKGQANRSGLAGAIPGLKQQGGNGTALHPHVAARDTTGNLRSFVVLPAGTYDVEDRFERLGTFVNGQPQCVARTVTYDVQVPANVTKVTVTGFQDGEPPLELKPEAVFSITNLEDQRNGDPHFRLYKHMFANEVTIEDIVRSATECGEGTEEYFYETCPTETFKNVGVECTNSQYP